MSIYFFFNFFSIYHVRTLIRSLGSQKHSTVNLSNDKQNVELTTDNIQPYIVFEKGHYDIQRVPTENGKKMGKKNYTFKVFCQ